MKDYRKRFYKLYPAYLANSEDEQLIKEMEEILARILWRVTREFVDEKEIIDSEDTLDREAEAMVHDPDKMYERLASFNLLIDERVHNTDDAATREIDNKIENNYLKLVQIFPRSRNVADMGRRLEHPPGSPWEFAGDAWEAQVAKHPNDLFVIRAAAAFFTNFDTSRTRELYERAMELDPKNPHLLVDAARSLVHKPTLDKNIKKQKNAQAFQLMEKALSRTWDLERTPDMLYFAARYALDAGLPKKAKIYSTEYIEWERERTDDFRIGYSYNNENFHGLVLLANEDIAGAKLQLKRAAATDFTPNPRMLPSAPELREIQQMTFSLARELAKRGEFAAVKEHFETLKLKTTIPREWFDVWLEEAAVGEFSDWEYVKSIYLRGYTAEQGLEDDKRPYIESPDYDDCIQRGIVAFKGGDVAAGKLLLQESAAFVHDAWLKGPDFTLAELLLKSGEREAVVAFLQKWIDVWKSRNAVILRVWIKMIQNGTTPRMTEDYPDDTSTALRR